MGTDNAMELARIGDAGRPALVFPVGDALLEPFWPQGLGMNRGLHTTLNAVFCALQARERSLQDAAAEARFAYTMITMTSFYREVVPYENWTIDPLARLEKTLMGLARSRIKKQSTEKDDLPDRIAKLPATSTG